MLENFIMQVRRPKGVSCEREAFVAAALARAARLVSIKFHVVQVVT